MVAGANAESRRNKLVRYQINPTANWGPKAKAKRCRAELSPCFLNIPQPHRRRRRAGSEARGRGARAVGAAQLTAQCSCDMQ